MNSLGFIETRGLTGSLEAADAMLKAARVHLSRRREIGSALVTVIVEGELGAVQAAVEAGAAAAERLGQLVSVHIIARPFEDTENWLGLARTSPRPLADPPRQVKKTAPPRKKKPAVKAPPETKQPVEQESDTSGAVILTLLRKTDSGLSLESIADQSGWDKKNIRRALKTLLDQGKIEKVKNLYFPLES